MHFFKNELSFKVNHNSTWCQKWVNINKMLISSYLLQSPLISVVPKTGIIGSDSMKDSDKHLTSTENQVNNFIHSMGDEADDIL